jgi:DNA-binding transcriptional ArsR family regulator
VAALSPLRRRVLEELDEPASATAVAARLGEPRQKVNYHLRVLEREGLVELVDERRRRGFVERRLQAVARDRFSSAYLQSAATRLAADVAELRRSADEAGETAATITVETEIRFASPRDLRAFADNLAAALGRLAAQYDRPDLPSARRFRLVAGAHSTITKETP